MVDTRETRGSATELKFLVDPADGARIRQWARARLQPDPHGTGPFGDAYLTTSLYFDTGERDVFHRRGSFGRAKYRIRRYGTVESVFLERKLRRSGMVIKRRTLLPLDGLPRLDRPDADRAWTGGWFHRRVLARGLGPVCQLSYHRMARGLLVDGLQARLTLDERLTISRVNQVHFNGAGGLPVLDDRLILELKFRGYLPAIFKSLIEEFKLAAETVSKYRFGMTVLEHRAATGEAPSAAENQTHG